MKEKPNYLGENYLGMLLEQILAQGYSVFAVKGKMDDSVADRRARSLPRPQTEGKGKEQVGMVPFSGKGNSLSSKGEEQTEEEDEETMLARAIQASLETNVPAPKDNMDEIRRKRLARLGG